MAEKKTKVRIAKAKDGGYEGIYQENQQVMQPIISSIQDKFPNKSVNPKFRPLSTQDPSRGFYIDIECKEKDTAVKLAVKLKKYLAKKFEKEYYVGVRIGGGFMVEGNYRAIEEVVPEEFED